MHAQLKHVFNSEKWRFFLFLSSSTMPSKRATSGRKRPSCLSPTTLAPKRQKRTKKNPRPLTTDDIPVLVREVCKNLWQQEDKEASTHSEEAQPIAEDFRKNGGQCLLQSGARGRDEPVKQDSTLGNYGVVKSSLYQSSYRLSTTRRRRDSNCWAHWHYNLAP